MEEDHMVRDDIILKRLHKIMDRRCYRVKIEFQLHFAGEVVDIDSLILNSQREFVATKEDIQNALVNWCAKKIPKDPIDAGTYFRDITVEHDMGYRMGAYVFFKLTDEYNDSLKEMEDVDRWRDAWENVAKYILSADGDDILIGDERYKVSIIAN